MDIGTTLVWIGVFIAIYVIFIKEDEMGESRELLGRTLIVLNTLVGLIVFGNGYLLDIVVIVALFYWVDKIQDYIKV